MQINKSLEYQSLKFDTARRASPDAGARPGRSDTRSRLDDLESLMYWRDPARSGIALGAGFALLVALACCSVVSVLAYGSLLLLVAAVAFRIYKNVLQAVQKTNDGHPFKVMGRSKMITVLTISSFKWLLEKDISIPAERAQASAAAATAHLNAVAAELRRLGTHLDLHSFAAKPTTKHNVCVELGSPFYICVFGEMTYHSLHDVRRGGWEPIRWCPISVNPLKSMFNSLDDEVHSNRSTDQRGGGGSHAACRRQAPNDEFPESNVIYNKERRWRPCRLFLVEDLVDSLKFGVLLWCLTYVGACFNGITLIILGWIALFTLPKAYEMNKAQVDANLELARAKINEISAK
ncbi:Reticulon-3-A [Eumeta japonica]|uniref:Reticulon-like protein n=1 Tax=Eumeta variegata TaxID=151549 RepID=A0A4C1Z0M5_EUMVA|nr:Reticulon-3-A [Eumeta japonica]